MKYYSSFESLHRDKSNGGKIKSLTLILHQLIIAKEFYIFIDGGRNINARDLLLAPFDSSQRDGLNELLIIVFGLLDGAQCQSKNQNRNFKFKI